MRSARRFNKPRKIGADSSDEGESSSPVVVKKKPTAPTTSDSQDAPTVTRPKIKRPTSTTLGLSEPSSRLSFNDDTDPTTNSEDSKFFQIKKSALSRKALERSAANRAGIRKPLPLHRGNDDDVPDEKPNLYSKEYLAELRSSTPSTPIHIGTKDGGGDGEDIVMTTGEDPLGTFSKFGTTAAASAAAALASSKSASIPDPALVKILKARRAAEAAKSTTTASSTSKTFISLSPSDDDSDSANKKKKSTRLVRPSLLDEDDDPELSSFINDPSASTSVTHPTRLILTNALSSRKGAESEARNLRQSQIQQALELSDTDASSNSDASPSHHSDSDNAGPGHDTWHRRQLRIATGGKVASTSSTDPTSSLEARLAYQPPNIPPVPDLSSKLKWLGDVLEEMTKIRDETVKKVEEVRREKEEIVKRESEVQEGLKRVGEEYAKLGLGKLEEEVVGGTTRGGIEGMGRGLESLGTPT